MDPKKLLCYIFKSNILGNRPQVRELSSLTHLEPESIKKLVKGLEEKKLVRIVSKGLEVTSKGRALIKVVMAGGVFDIIHPGHIYTLKKAKSLGDFLVVSIARDKTVERLRGKKPINHENLRKNLVEELRAVDVVILGSEKDMFETIEKIKPDIIALGYDQVHDEKHLMEEGMKRGLSYKVIRLDSPYPDLKSRYLKSNPEMLNSF